MSHFPETRVTRTKRPKSDASPAIVALISSVAAKAALRELPCEVLRFASYGQLKRTKANATPRLTVVEAAADPDNFLDILKLFRAEWPLADIVIWAPKAAGSLVRTAFRAGAKDVVLSSVASRLTKTLQEILNQQQFLPLVDELANKRARGSRFESMLSRSDQMWDLFAFCACVAPSTATVLIVGETGTGKELLARALHRRSGRSGRFVATNCGSVAPELIESELFGHEKGAFTGAHRAKTGLVRHAEGGTLFLDEIGDMPMTAQTSLLRLLQEGTMRAVGGHDEISVDVRIVAATNVALDEAVTNGEFRQDLFYRLDVIRLNIPPLRDRPEDIVYLFGHFTRKLAKHYGLPPVRVSDAFLEEITNFDWPGNVRQLENFAERVVLAGPQRRLSRRDFNRFMQHSRPRRAAKVGRRVHAITADLQNVDLSKTLDDHLVPAVERLERNYLEALLQKNRGKIGISAEQAGISRRTLLRKLKSLEIDKEDFRV